MISKPQLLSRVALLTALLMCLVPAANAKMYKWTDAEGNVHYTQTPPPASAQQSKSMKVRTGTTVRVRKRGKKLYCGKRALPRLSDRPAVAISNLEGNLLGWEDNIERSKEDRAKYIKSNAKRATTSRFNKRLKRYDDEVAELECQVAWARKELEKRESDREGIVAHAEDLDALVTELKRRKVAECGADSRTGIIRVDDAYRDYQRCVRPYDREIRKVERSLKKARRDAKMVKE